MKPRCEVDISFNSENDAIAFLNLIQVIKNKMFVGTGDEKIPTMSKCRYHECSHDETNPKPCKDYVNYDLAKVDIEEVKTKLGVLVSASDLLK